MKQNLILFALSVMLLSSNQLMADSTNMAPPSVTMESSASSPPVCNTSNQMLHWTGSAWKCIVNPGLTQLGKGAVERITEGNCPSGTTRHHISTHTTTGFCGGATTAQCSFSTPKYICIKN